MTTTFAKAPTLAWLLTALACFLSGMAVVEGRHQAVAMPDLAPAGVVVTVEVICLPAATPDPATPEPVAGGASSLP